MSQQDLQVSPAQCARNSLASASTIERCSSHSAQISCRVVEPMDRTNLAYRSPREAEYRPGGNPVIGSKSGKQFKWPDTSLHLLAEATGTRSRMVVVDAA